MKKKKIVNGYEILDLKIRQSLNELLSISADYDYDAKNDYAVILYVPDKKKFTHYHIGLSRGQVVKLQQWCDSFLKRRKNE